MLPAAAFDGKLNGIVIAGSVAPAATGLAALAVAVQVTVCPLACVPELLHVHGPCGDERVPNVRNGVSWSVTVNVPEVIAVVPPFPAVRVSTPVPPGATDPPTVLPTVCVAVSVNGGGPTTWIMSGTVAVTAAPFAGA